MKEELIVLSDYLDKIGQELVTPRLIRAVFFMKGFGRFEVPLKFIDGQQIYKVSTIGF